MHDGRTTKGGYESDNSNEELSKICTLLKITIVEDYNCQEVLWTIPASLSLLIDPYARSPNECHSAAMRWQRISLNIDMQTSVHEYLIQRRKVMNFAKIKLHKKYTRRVTTPIDSDLKNTFYEAYVQ